MTEIKKLLDICRAATPGKWEYVRDPVTYGFALISKSADAVIVKGNYQACDGFFIETFNPTRVERLLLGLEIAKGALEKISYMVDTHQEAPIAVEALAHIDAAIKESWK